MPIIIIKPSPEKAVVNTDKATNSSEELYRSCEEMKHPMARFAKRVPYNNAAFKSVMHSSIRDVDEGTVTKLIPYANGFIEGVIRAYQQDLHLVLRPDDVWQAVIKQFSLYVVAHTEELRDEFVAHESKKKLEFNAGLSPESINIAKVARKLPCLIKKALGRSRDPEPDHP